MYELIQVTENTYYIESPAKIGLVRTGGSDVVPHRQRQRQGRRT